MADIFISYKREDQEEHGRVHPIAEALRAEGYDVFYDVQVPPGSSWEDFLQSKINAARAVLVLWSAASVSSDWVKEEAEMAKTAGKLIPVFLDPVAPPFGFARIEGANLAGWNGDLSDIEWKNLVAAIKARIGAGEGPVKPELARVAYMPAKTVTVTKAAPRKSGGALRLVAALVGIAVIAGLGLVGWSLVRENQTLSDSAADNAYLAEMARQIEKDQNDWRNARGVGTIAAYQTYLDLQPTGAYRADALAAIEALEAPATEPPPPVAAAPADLRVSSLAVSTPSVAAGGTLRAMVDVSNVGDSPAPGSADDGYWVDLVLSRDAQAPVQLAVFSDSWSEDAMPRGGRISNTREISANGGAQSYTVTMSIPGGWPAGRFNLCAIADPGGKVVERSEANNVACTPLAVTGAPAPTPATPAGPIYLVNGATIRITNVQPAGDTISLIRQNFAVSFAYSVPTGQRMDILVQPGYTGPGTCRWSASGQPGVVAGTGTQTVDFQFTGEACSSKSLEKVSFRVAPEADSSDWKSVDHPLRFGFR